MLRLFPRTNSSSPVAVCPAKAAILSFYFLDTTRNKAAEEMVFA